MKFIENIEINGLWKKYDIHWKLHPDVNILAGINGLFLRTINQLFEKTGKKIESDKNNEIVFRKDDEILTPYQLSSGEKQVLIILLTVLIQDNEPYILIMDEPEISLHTDWQENLIYIIRELNNNVQIILTTHSFQYITCLLLLNYNALLSTHH